MPEKKPTNQQPGKVVEFDLPPPPPSRFLPDEERTKVLSINKQGRPENVGAQQRVRIVAGATNNTRTQPSPQVQIHHLQVPRLIQKTQSSQPSQITHFIVSSTSSFAPQPTLLTTTFQPFTVAQTIRTTTTEAPFTELHFETEAPTTSPVSHLSTARVGGKKVNKRLETKIISQ